MVTTEATTSSTLSDDTITTIVEDDTEESESNVTKEAEDDADSNEKDGEAQNVASANSTSPCSVTPDNEESPICMVSTACGDYHNLGLDTSGQAFSLPSPLHFSSFPGGAQQKVTQVVCGKVRQDLQRFQ